MDQLRFSLRILVSFLDATAGSWFIANDSRLWIRFISTEFSLGFSIVRLYYRETIQCKEIDQMIRFDPFFSSQGQRNHQMWIFNFCIKLDRFLFKSRVYRNKVFIKI